MVRGINDDQPTPGVDDPGFTVCERGICIAETDKSIKVKMEDQPVYLDYDSVMIPKSQIHPNSEVFELHDAQLGKLIVSQWLADQRGWSNGEDIRPGSPGQPKRKGFFGVESPPIPPTVKKKKK